MLTAVLYQAGTVLTIRMESFVFSNTPLSSLPIQLKLFLLLLSLELMYSLIMVIHSYR